MKQRASRRTPCCGIAYNGYELIQSDFVSPQASSSSSHVQPARSSYHHRTPCCGIAYNGYELIQSDFVSPQASSSSSHVQPARSSYHRRVCLYCGKVTARDRGSAIAIMAVGRVRRVFNVSLWSRTTFEALLETI
jgi:hypothetical protein